MEPNDSASEGRSPRDPERAAPSRSALFAAMRPRQWVKNLFVFAALVFADRVTDPTAVALAVAAFVVFCLLSSAAYLLNDVVQGTVLRMRSDVEDKVNRLPLSYFDAQPRGELLSRVTNDIDNVSTTLQQTMSQLLTSILTVIGVLSMMLWISPLLALVALASVPISMLVTRAVMRRSHGLFVQQWRSTGKLNAHIEETFSGHALVKVFGRQHEAERIFDEQNEYWYLTCMQSGQVFKGEVASDKVLETVAIPNTYPHGLGVSTAANRILVARELYEPFLERFARAVRELRVGPGLDERSQIGPLMHQAAFDSTDARVRDAIEQGARLLAGGEPHALGGWFYQPTLLADVAPQMRIWREENFAPIAGVTPYDSVDEAVTLANDSEYGLAAYICSQRVDRIWPLMRQLEFAMVAVNGAKFTGHPIPFGGMKASGLGREGGSEGFEPFVETKYFCLHHGQF